MIYHTPRARSELGFLPREADEKLKSRANYKLLEVELHNKRSSGERCKRANVCGEGDRDRDWCWASETGSKKRLD